MKLQKMMAKIRDSEWGVSAMKGWISHGILSILGLEMDQGNDMEWLLHGRWTHKLSSIEKLVSVRCKGKGVDIPDDRDFDKFGMIQAF